MEGFLSLCTTCTSRSTTSGSVALSVLPRFTVAWVGATVDGYDSLCRVSENDGGASGDDSVDEVFSASDVGLDDERRVLSSEKDGSTSSHILRSI